MPIPDKGHNEGFLRLVSEAKRNIEQVDIEGYRKLVASGAAFFLIDVREDHEWQAEHASGAIHLGKGIIERDIESRVPDKAAKLVLYCGGGFRSALAADALRKMGYSDAISLDGGWREWKQAGLPSES